jgi:Flp pilus assembly protein TadD
MTTPTPTGGPPSTPDPPNTSEAIRAGAPPPGARASPAPAAPANIVRWPGGRRWLLAGVLSFLLAGAGGAWWWLHCSSPLVTPPMPGGIEDPEVRRALERARQEVLDNPRSAGAWGHLGKLLLAHIFPGEADVCFAEAARLDPADPLWVYARGVIALRRDPEKPVTLLRQAVAVAATGSKHRSAMSLQLAEALLERGDLEEAETIFRRELEQDPRSARAAFGLGLIAIARGDEPAATKFLATARNSPYARKKVSAQLAALARVRGDQKAADTYQKQAAELPDDPPWPDPILDETASMRIGWRGRERLAGLLERQSIDAKTAEEKRNLYAKAAEVYLEQLDLRPNVPAYIGAGMNLARLRDYERALPLLREAVRLEPDNASAHSALALALFARAEREWHTSPGSSQLKEWFREAIKHARQATQLRPSLAQAYLYWGLALKYLDEPGAAVEPLRKGVACAPADRELQLGLGEVLLEVGQFKEAEVHLTNAQRLAPPNDPRPARALERLRLKKS